MDDFKAKHDELNCKMGCRKRQPNKVARRRLKEELKKRVEEERKEKGYKP